MMRSSAEAVNTIEQRGRFYYENYEGPSSQRNFNFPPVRRDPIPVTLRPPAAKETEVVTQRRRSSGRCQDGSYARFKQLRSRTRLKPAFIQKGETVNSLQDCERLCLQESNFLCLSFNYIQRINPTLNINCELSSEDYTQLDFANANFFEISEDHDYYGRERSFRNGGGEDSCIDVTQECTPGTCN